MQRSTSPLALALQKADRDFRANAGTADEITRPVILIPIARRRMRETEPTLQLYLEIEAPSMQVDDEFERPLPPPGAWEEEG
ncbi:MAG: hypothetical protein M3S32_00720 [Acidobacteriota bacterium]|nr:hypothetical protein [Acidobacteriota bacterium]